MDNKENTKISENKRIFIVSAILALMLVASIVAVLVLQASRNNASIAIIYVDGEKYTEINLEASEDMTLTITASNGSHNTIEIKNHNIRMQSAECKNNLCVNQGWAKDTLLPIVCLPNNVVITISGPTNNDKEDNSYDAITY